MPLATFACRKYTFLRKNVSAVRHRRSSVTLGRSSTAITRRNPRRNGHQESINNYQMTRLVPRRPRKRARTYQGVTDRVVNIQAINNLPLTCN